MRRIPTRAGRAGRLNLNAGALSHPCSLWSYGTRATSKVRLSRPVFAVYLPTNPRALENWEQGRAKPNAQAALLIRLVEKFLDTVERLAVV